VSVWTDTPRITVRHRTRLENERCDVAVVGAGISGALVALKLAEQGHDVVVIDRREPGRGSTLASTAMIQFELDTPLTELGEKIGSKNAGRAYRRSFEAVKTLGDVIDRHGFSCGWKPRDALYLAGNEAGARALKTEAEARAKIGLPSRFLDKHEVGSEFEMDRTAAILSGGAAEVNPAQLSAACLRKAQHLGARLYARHDVIKATPDKRGVELETENGAVISARRAVFTTGYEVMPGLPRSKFDIISTWAIATKPIPAKAFWPTRCLVWEASDPYLYMRTTADNRILVGGEDSGLNDADRRQAAIPNKSRRLLEKVCALLPGRKLEIDYAWAGAFADSPTGLPYFSEVEDLPHCFAVLGCGGNGITFSVIAAEVVTRWVEGRRDPDSDLFA
jgi:glycine/D-amino acid oxidase-like deaminating enzyme